MNFIVFQFLRTPSAKERHINAFNTFWSGIKKEYTRRKELGKETKGLEEVAKSFMREHGIRLEKLTEFMLDEDLPIPSDDFILSTIPGLGLLITKKLINQNWAFLFSTPENPWLTSDDPFCVFENKEMERLPIIPKGSTSIVPLSKEVCLVIQDKDQSIINAEGVPDVYINRINLGIAEKASRFVYAPNNECLKKIVADLKRR